MPDTTTLIVSVFDSSPSLAVSVNTYVPGDEKVAVVERRFAFPNVTVPGPLVFVHVVTSGLTMPSSLAEPDRAAVAGRVTAASGPAFTTGGVFVVPVNGAPGTHVQPVLCDIVPFWLWPDESLTMPKPSSKPQRPSSPVALVIGRVLPLAICAALRA